MSKTRSLRKSALLAPALSLALATATPAWAIIWPAGYCSTNVIDCRSGTCVPMTCAKQSVTSQVLDASLNWISGKRFAW